MSDQRAVTRHPCVDLIDEALKARGVRLALCIEFDGQTGRTLSTPRVMVEPLDDSRTAKTVARTCNMLASHCPWCGVELERLP